MTDQIRTFIAVELEPAQRNALGDIQERFKRERAGRCVRWVAPENIHLTLKFLGSVDVDRLTSLQAAVADACQGIPPFTLKIGGVGAFPNIRRPRVVWIGLGGQVDIAAHLTERIDEACAELGFAREARPFSPHLTLGRIKRDASASDQQFVGEMVTRAQMGDVGELLAHFVNIMKSDLRPTGSVYTRLHAIELTKDG